MVRDAIVTSALGSLLEQAEDDDQMFNLVKEKLMVVDKQSGRLSMLGWFSHWLANPLRLVCSYVLSSYTLNAFNKAVRAIDEKSNSVSWLIMSMIEQKDFFYPGGSQIMFDTSILQKSFTVDRIFQILTHPSDLFRSTLLADLFHCSVSPTIIFRTGLSILRLASEGLLPALQITSTLKCLIEICPRQLPLILDEDFSAKLPTGLQWALGCRIMCKVLLYTLTTLHDASALRAAIQAIAHFQYSDSQILISSFSKILNQNLPASVESLPFDALTSFVGIESSLSQTTNTDASLPRQNDGKFNPNIMHMDLKADFFSQSPPDASDGNIFDASSLPSHENGRASIFPPFEAVSVWLCLACMRALRVSNDSLSRRVNELLVIPCMTLPALGVLINCFYVPDLVINSIFSAVSESRLICQQQQQPLQAMAINTQISYSANQPSSVSQFMNSNSNSTIPHTSTLPSNPKSFPNNGTIKTPQLSPKTPSFPNTKHIQFSSPGSVSSPVRTGRSLKPVSSTPTANAPSSSVFSSAPVASPTTTNLLNAFGNDRCAFLSSLCLSPYLISVALGMASDEQPSKARSRLAAFEILTMSLRVSKPATVTISMVIDLVRHFAHQGIFGLVIQSAALDRRSGKYLVKSGGQRIWGSLSQRVGSQGIQPLQDSLIESMTNGLIALVDVIRSDSSSLTLRNLMSTDDELENNGDSGIISEENVIEVKTLQLLNDLSILVGEGIFLDYPNLFRASAAYISTVGNISNLDALAMVINRSLNEYLVTTHNTIAIDSGVNKISSPVNAATILTSDHLLSNSPNANTNPLASKGISSNVRNRNKFSVSPSPPIQVSAPAITTPSPPVSPQPVEAQFSRTTALARAQLAVQAVDVHSLRSRSLVKTLLAASKDPKLSETAEKCLLRLFIDEASVEEFIKSAILTIAGMTRTGEVSNATSVIPATPRDIRRACFCLLRLETVVRPHLFATLTKAVRRIILIRTSLPVVLKFIASRVLFFYSKSHGDLATWIKTEGLLNKECDKLKQHSPSQFSSISKNNQAAGGYNSLNGLNIQQKTNSNGFYGMIPMDCEPYVTSLLVGASHCPPKSTQAVLAVSHLSTTPHPSVSSAIRERLSPSLPSEDRIATVRSLRGASNAIASTIGPHIWSLIVTGPADVSFAAWEVILHSPWIGASNYPQLYKHLLQIPNDGLKISNGSLSLSLSSRQLNLQSESHQNSEIQLTTSDFMRAVIAAYPRAHALASKVATMTLESLNVKGAVNIALSAIETILPPGMTPAAAVKSLLSSSIANFDWVALASACDSFEKYLPEILSQPSLPPLLKTSDQNFNSVQQQALLFGEQTENDDDSGIINAILSAIKHCASIMLQCKLIKILITCGKLSVVVDDGGLEALLFSIRIRASCADLADVVHFLSLIHTDSLVVLLPKIVVAIKLRILALLNSFASNSYGSTGGMDLHSSTLHINDKNTFDISSQPIVGSSPSGFQQTSLTPPKNSPALQYVGFSSLLNTGMSKYSHSHNGLSGHLKLKCRLITDSKNISDFKFIIEAISSYEQFLSSLYKSGALHYSNSGTPINSSSDSNLKGPANSSIFDTHQGVNDGNDVFSSAINSYLHLFVGEDLFIELSDSIQNNSIIDSSLTDIVNALNDFSFGTGARDSNVGVGPLLKLFGNVFSQNANRKSQHINVNSATLNNKNMMKVPPSLASQSSSVLALNFGLDFLVVDSIFIEALSDFNKLDQALIWMQQFTNHAVRLSCMRIVGVLVDVHLPALFILTSACLHLVFDKFDNGLDSYQIALLRAIATHPLLCEDEMLMSAVSNLLVSILNLSPKQSILTTPVGLPSGVASNNSVLSGGMATTSTYHHARGLMSGTFSQKDASFDKELVKTKLLIGIGPATPVSTRRVRISEPMIGYENNLNLLNNNVSNSSGNNNNPFSLPSIVSASTTKQQQSNQQNNSLYYPAEPPSPHPSTLHSINNVLDLALSRISRLLHIVDPFLSRYKACLLLPSSNSPSRSAPDSPLTFLSSLLDPPESSTLPATDRSLLSRILLTHRGGWHVLFARSPAPFDCPLPNGRPCTWHSWALHEMVSLIRFAPLRTLRPLLVAIQSTFLLTPQSANHFLNLYSHFLQATPYSRLDFVLSVNAWSIQNPATVSPLQFILSISRAVSRLPVRRVIFDVLHQSIYTLRGSSSLDPLSSSLARDADADPSMEGEILDRLLVFDRVTKTLPPSLRPSSLFMGSSHGSHSSKIMQQNLSRLISSLHSPPMRIFLRQTPHDIFSSLSAWQVQPHAAKPSALCTVLARALSSHLSLALSMPRPAENLDKFAAWTNEIVSSALLSCSLSPSACEDSIINIMNSSHATSPHYLPSSGSLLPSYHHLTISNAINDRNSNWCELARDVQGIFTCRPASLPAIQPPLPPLSPPHQLVGLFVRTWLPNKLCLSCPVSPPLPPSLSPPSSFYSFVALPSLSPPSLVLPVSPPYSPHTPEICTLPPSTTQVQPPPMPWIIGSSPAATIRLDVSDAATIPPIAALVANLGSPPLPCLIALDSESVSLVPPSPGVARKPLLLPVGRSTLTVITPFGPPLNFRLSVSLSAACEYAANPAPTPIATSLPLNRGSALHPPKTPQQSASSANRGDGSGWASTLFLSPLTSPSVGKSAEFPTIEMIAPTSLHPISTQLTKPLSKFIVYGSHSMLKCKKPPESANVILKSANRIKDANARRSLETEDSSPLSPVTPFKLEFIYCRNAAPELPPRSRSSPYAESGFAASTQLAKLDHELSHIGWYVKLHDVVNGGANSPESVGNSNVLQDIQIKLSKFAPVPLSPQMSFKIGPCVFGVATRNTAVIVENNSNL